MINGKKPDRLCNYRYKENCSLAGKCLATTATEKRKLYYGTSDREFKTRFNNHTRLFKHKRDSSDTELSKYIWKISNDKIQYVNKRNIAAYASPYICGSRRSDLCLIEKLQIKREDPEFLLSKRSELLSIQIFLANIK